MLFLNNTPIHLYSHASSSSLFALVERSLTDHNASMSSSFMEQLRQPRPFPGGGSAAAHVGALSLALVEKVVRIEIKRREPDSPAFPVWNNRLSQVTNLAARFESLLEEDGRAYAGLSRVRAEKADAVAVFEAVREAVIAPARIISACAEGLGLISEIIKECRSYLVADLLVSVELLEAAAKGAEAIATANVLLLESTERRAELLNILTQAVDDVNYQYYSILSK